MSKPRVKSKINTHGSTGVRDICDFFKFQDLTKFTHKEDDNPVISDTRLVDGSTGEDEIRGGVEPSS